MIVHITSSKRRKREKSAKAVMEVRTLPVRGAATWAWKAWVLPTNEDVIDTILLGLATGSVIFRTVSCEITLLSLLPCRIRS